MMANLIWPRNYFNHHTGSGDSKNEDGIPRNDGGEVSLCTSNNNDWCNYVANMFGPTENSCMLKKEEQEKRANPFQTTSFMTMREMVKLTFGLVVLAPIRFFCVLVILLVASALLQLTVLGVDISQPLSPTRAVIQKRITVVSGWLACLCLGIFGIEVKGELGDCNMVVVAPHSTIMDSFVVAYIAQGGSGLAKKEAETSIIGPFLKATQGIFVDREDRASRERTCAAIQERVSPDSPWKRKFVLFPEGTSTNRTSLIQFRKGAFEPGAPVQPVILHWRYKNFDPSWTAGASSRTLIALRTLSQIYNSVTVEILDVYTPSKIEQENPILYAQNVRAEMASHLQIPTTEHSYPDMFLAKIAAKQGLKPCKALDFTFESLRSSTKMARDNDNNLFAMTKALLLIFSKAPGMTRDGQMNKSMFEAVAQVAREVVAVEERILWAKSDNDTMSFHEFLLTFFHTVK